MSWADQGVFITGHTGFKGAWLSRLMLLKGAKVKGYALAPDTQPALFDLLELGQDMDHEIADINNRETLSCAVTEFQPDVIFHLAAQSLVRRSYADPVDTWATNVQGTVNVLEAARTLNKDCRVIIVTTDKVYANNEQGDAFSETDALGGHDPYSASKAACELVVESYRKSFFAKGGNIQVASVRAGNVIGGGDWSEDRLVPDIIRALATGETIDIRNPGAIRPWQHVLDPINGYVQLAEKMKDARTFNQAYNFGPDIGDQRSVEELVEAILKTWPGKWRDVSDPMALHEANILKLSIDQARSELNWRPKWNFETAVEETVNWYRAVHEGQCPKEITDQQIKRFAS